MRAKARRTTANPRSERLEARVSPDQKLLFQRAAALRGVGFSEFVIDSVHAAAVRTVEEHEVLVLGPREKQKFIDILMSPPDPNDRLRAAAERYQRLVKRD
jgi:uncharacterized protein (DUF1778 family)